MSSPSRRLVKKVCLVGDFAVGKTSLVRRFVEGCFDERYLSTLGVKVDRKTLSLETPEGTFELTLMLWDLAGGPEIGPVVPAYYRGSAGVILACDLTRPETLPGLMAYAEGFLETNPGARLVIAANKADLVEERRVEEKLLTATSADLGAPLFLTSAKTGEQVEAVFEGLGLLLVA